MNVSDQNVEKNFQVLNRILFSEINGPHLPFQIKNRSFGLKRQYSSYFQNLKQKSPIAYILVFPNSVLRCRKWEKCGDFPCKQNTFE